MRKSAENSEIGQEQSDESGELQEGEPDQSSNGLKTKLFESKKRLHETEQLYSDATKANNAYKNEISRLHCQIDDLIASNMEYSENRKKELHIILSSAKKYQQCLRNTIRRQRNLIQANVKLAEEEKRADDDTIKSLTNSGEALRCENSRLNSLFKDPEIVLNANDEDTHFRSRTAINGYFMQLNSQIEALKHENEEYRNHFLTFFDRQLTTTIHELDEMEDGSQELSSMTDSLNAAIQRNKILSQRCDSLLEERGNLLERIGCLEDEQIPDLDERLKEIKGLVKKWKISNNDDHLIKKLAIEKLNGLSGDGLSDGSDGSSSDDEAEMVPESDALRAELEAEKFNHSKDIQDFNSRISELESSTRKQEIEDELLKRDIGCMKDSNTKVSENQVQKLVIRRFHELIKENATLNEHKRNSSASVENNILNDAGGVGMDTMQKAVEEIEKQMKECQKS